MIVCFSHYLRAPCRQPHSKSNGWEHQNHKQKNIFQIQIEIQFVCAVVLSWKIKWSIQLVDERREEAEISEDQVRLTNWSVWWNVLKTVLFIVLHFALITPQLNCYYVLYTCRIVFGASVFAHWFGYSIELGQIGHILYRWCGVNYVESFRLHNCHLTISSSFILEFVCVWTDQKEKRRRRTSVWTNVVCEKTHLRRWIIIVFKHLMKHWRQLALTTIHSTLLASPTRPIIGITATWMDYRRWNKSKVRIQLEYCVCLLGVSFLSYSQ